MAKQKFRIFHEFSYFYYVNYYLSVENFLLIFSVYSCF